MNKKQNMLKLIEELARIKQEEDSKRWPPPCVGLLHQPKRPVKKK